MRWPGASWPVHSKSVWAAAVAAVPKRIVAARTPGFSNLCMHASLNAGLDGEACPRVYGRPEGLPLLLDVADLRAWNPFEDARQVAHLPVLVEDAVRADAD